MADHPNHEAPAAAAREGRAADSLFRDLAEKISSGELRDGDPLPPEREIVETYGVSRTVVREAVATLSNRGLIEARPRHRPIVRKPSFETAFDAVDDMVMQLLQDAKGVRNLFDIRIMIEAALAREAAASATKDDIVALREALEANEKAIDDSAQFFKTDIAFHNVFYRIPNNPVLPAIHKAYTSWLEPHWLRMPRQPDRNRLNNEAHRKIYEAVLLRDPDAAELALRNHLADAWDQVCQTFSDVQRRQIQG
ncbi:FCD domain-containing protein [Rhodobacteraceae bacterium NNCM2]|nr:FCD domain-containing protein [Coraliihabitans acroporae]